jgi:hypothetical protein
MIDAKPKALQLVEESENGDWIVGTGQWREEAAAELRRLHEENTALRQAIKQAELAKPVAWMYVNEDGECEQIEQGTEGCDDPDVQPLYTAPPQRGWVGLHWEDMPEEYAGNRSFLDGANWAESRLKEKNGG